ncbi:hypothetical protein BFD03_05520 [Limosilactobacillus reuteri]|uniref:Uncharacterized protein n=1 Tax=Limosilactobacillus reuteri TaxID=1598 RepID=A0A1C2G9N1_LIMRT|nr:hypothetical protein [Limosilactobacillus reuteri]MCC4332641.1 hypothetical protein [Limosilactobacillus reuteri]MCC4342785.1 hypothetical protein [Limosilactobacillus reuteri]MCC4353825.1 hypothetical protein [Limosilactobacillus reuteri]OCX48211.1 hypothetical protein BFD03_05520 [Limosilactobacillus reuteri]
MGKPQFNFECKVVVHTANANLTYQYGKMKDSIEIHFTVPFSNETEKHITEIELFNIDPNHFNLIQPGNKAELYAGYSGDVGLLVSGTIYKTTIPYAEDADTAYKIRILEGEDYTRKPKINMTFANNTYASTIIPQVVSTAGINLRYISIKDNKCYNDGFTADDHPMEVLSTLAQDCKASLFYLRGQLTMRYVYDGNGADQFDLSPATGLVEGPTRESRDDDWADYEDDDDGLGAWSYSATSILNYHLTTFAWVKLHNKYANVGVMVINGEHSFDGEEARTEFEAVTQ